MTVGLYDGKIIDVSPNQLVVREYVMDYKGRLKPKDTILKLRKEEE
jgi:Tfp pilus assembly protein PilP